VYFNFLKKVTIPASKVTENALYGIRTGEV